jgi:hypothetical protein
MWWSEKGSERWKDWTDVRGRRDNLDITMVLLIWTLNYGHCCCCCRARNLWKIAEPPDYIQFQSLCRCRARNLWGKSRSLQTACKFRVVTSDSTFNWVLPQCI